MAFDRVISQVHFKGTGRLLALTDGLDEDRRKELLTYIGALEGSQTKLAESIMNFLNEISNPIDNVTFCYYCHGQHCERCFNKDR